MQISLGRAKVCNREATFTASPMAVYSVRRAEPKLPTTTRPVLMPNRTRSWSGRVSRRFEFAHPVAHFQCRANGGTGAVVAGDRGAEERHHGIADIFVDRAAVGENDFRHRGQIVADEMPDFRGIQAFAHFGERDDVGKQHGHNAFGRRQRIFAIAVAA